MSARRAVLLAAVFTDPVNLKRVSSGEVVIFVSDFLLKLSDFLREKLNRTAATGTDHVMMAAAVVLVLVAGDPVMKCNFTGQAAFGQQLERAVNGGVADAGIFLLDQAMEFVGGKMVAGFQKGAQDGVPLGRLLQSHALEMAVQDILCLANHLAGESGLIIDAFLQHGG